MSAHAHFVTFYAPGTFVAESTTREIDSWDVEKAMEMARGMKMRYNAAPYGFRFTTRARRDDELDSRQIDQSPFYFLGGKVETIDEVRRRNDPKERILLSNMECNGYDRIIINTNSFKWTQPLEKDDIVLDFVL